MGGTRRRFSTDAIGKLRLADDKFDGIADAATTSTPAAGGLRIPLVWAHQ